MLLCLLILLINEDKLQQASFFAHCGEYSTSYVYSYAYGIKRLLLDLRRLELLSHLEVDFTTFIIKVDFHSYTDLTF